MRDDRQYRQCPHCDGPLRPFILPDNSGWQEPAHWACFNDDCPYYIRGWKWMREQYNVAGSYRHRLDPETGQSGPLPVWSAEDFRGNIIADPEEGISHGE